MIQALFPQNYLLIITAEHVLLYRLGNRSIKEHWSFSLLEAGGLENALQQVRHSCVFKADDSIVVGLAAHYFSVVTFTLPRAAADNLTEAVRYELFRHLPYDPEIAWQHMHLDDGVDGTDDTLKISVTLAPKQPLQDIFAQLSASGLAPTGIAPALSLLAWLVGKDGCYLQSSPAAVELMVQSGGRITFNSSAIPAENNIIAAQDGLFNQLQAQPFDSDSLWYLAPTPPQIGDSLHINHKEPLSVAPGHPIGALKKYPYKIDLVAAAKLARQRYWKTIQLAILATVVLSFLSLPLAHLYARNSALSRLDQQIVAVKQRAENLSSIRMENQSIKDSFTALASYRGEQSQAIAALKEITDILPNSTWLSSFNLNDRRLSLRGTSVTATEVVEAMENSPLFSEVHFDSPVVKKGSLETFTIVATLNKG